MSDSVGRISLDLEINSNLTKQVSDVSTQLGKQLENTFINSTKSIFDGLNEGIEANMKVINNTIKVALEQMQTNVNAAIDGIMSISKGIKTPKPDEKPQSTPIPNSPNVITPSIPRAPPVVIPEMPKVPSINMNTEQLKTQIENLTARLDIVNAKIEQQQEKLLRLKETYNTTFNEARKNKLQEQILNTEATINKLIATSDKLGFKLADLDALFLALGATANQSAASINVASNSAGNATSKFGGRLKALGKLSKDTGDHMRNTHNQMNMMFRSLLTWGIIFPIIIRGLTAMGTAIGSSLMVNKQFANSFNQIKSNMITAFMPIYNAVLPSLNSLMSSLATATAYIASFVSQLFGSTYNASFGAAKALQSSIGAYGQQEKAAKKAATALSGAGSAAKKAAKDAKGSLAGFDEINQLQGNKDTTNDGEGSGVVTPITPMANMAPIEAQTSGWVPKFKSILDTIFQPLRNAWAKDGAGVMDAFNNAINESKYIIKSFFDMLATPPVQLFIENVARIGLALVKLALSIYSNFILPIVNWFISILPGAAKGLNPILEVIRTIIDKLAENPTAITILCSVILGLVAAFKTLNICLQVAKWIAGIGEALEVLLANPVVLVIAAIAGLIVIFGLLYASNEKFRNVVNEVGAAIANFLKPTFEALKQTLVDVWNNAIIPLAKALEDFWHTVIEPLGKIIIDVLVMAFKILATVVKDLLEMVIVPLASFLASTFIKIVQSVIEIYYAWKPAVQVIIDIMLFLWNNVLKPVLSFLGSVFINTFKGVFQTLGDVIGAAQKIFGGLIDFITGVFTGNWRRAWEGVKEVFSGVFGGLGTILKAPLNAVIGLINTVLKGVDGVSGVLNNIPGVNITKTPKIPYLARGGVVDTPTLAMVGEAGKEAVMPLENNTGWINNLAGQISGQLGNSGNINVDLSEIVDLLKQILKALSDQSGDLIIKIGESEFARIAIAAINKRRRQTGVNELLV